MATPTMTIRAPAELHQLIRDVAWHAIRSPTFQASLRQAFKTFGQSQTVEALTLVDIAQKLDAIEALLQRPDAPAMRRPVFAPDRDDHDEGAWTVGTGLRRRLTRAGREECDRLLRADQQFAAIPRHLGIKPPSVASRYQRLMENE